MPFIVGIPLAVLGGLAMPLQSRINGALGTKLGDGLGAALVSFGVGLVLMILLSVLSARGRAGFKRIAPAVRNGELPWYYLLAGGIGAYFVLSQGLVAGILGIALFTVAAVTGQSVGALFVDRVGLSPAGKRAITPMRVIGVVLTIAAVLWAVSPRLQAGHDISSWLIPVLMPLTAGMLMGIQQAFNGTATIHYGTPITTTLMNFISGTAILAIFWGIKVAVSGLGNPLPTEFWYYLGGPLGCLFIGLAAILVKHLGVLLTGLGMIAGQLIGSLGLDLFFPTPGTIVAPATIFGTLLTLVAIVLASLPWPGAINPFRRRG